MIRIALRSRAVWILPALLLLAPAVRAQAVEPAPRSAGRAFLLNLAVPGLGQRYLNEGRWTRSAVLFAGADAALWLGLFGANWQLGHVVDSYTTLAASHAGTSVEGRSRAFFLNLSRYPSSEAYVDALLRGRSWEGLEEANDPANRWKWATREDWLRYRSLREDAESLRRQRPLLVTLLVANRLVSGIAALRTARRPGGLRADLSFTPPAFAGASVQAQLRLRF